MRLEKGMHQPRRVCRNIDNRDYDYVVSIIYGRNNPRISADAIG